MNLFGGIGQRMMTNRATTAHDAMIRLTKDPIDYAALTEGTRSADSGAVVLFLGTVRELTGGRRTVALDYDAYWPMAEAKMRELEAEARRRWPIDEVAIVHRVGRL